MGPKDVKRSVNMGNRLLHWLGVATAVAAGTGVLLSVPPFTLFIFPVYEQVHKVHGWISLAVGAPFVIAVFTHGVSAWRARGFSYLTKTGLLLTVAYLGALATGWHARVAAVKQPWV